MIKERIRKDLSSQILKWYEHNGKRVYLDIEPKDITFVGKYMFTELDLRFSTATASDTPKGIEILYHFSSDKTGEIFSVRVLIADKQKPSISSLALLFTGADWIEREMAELFGVEFIGHPDPRHLLLKDDWPQGEYPLRKSYKKSHEKKTRTED